MAFSDPFLNASGLISRVRTSYLSGGAAGNLTVTGIDLAHDRILSVASLSAAVTGGTAGGAHTVTAGEDTAGTLGIATGLASISGFSLLVVTAGGVHRALVDAAISISGGTITVADGGATFAVTATDVIYWTAKGSATGSTAAADLTSEFSITADDTINNTGGTATTGRLVVVTWYDHDFGDTVDPPWA